MGEWEGPSIPLDEFDGVRKAKVEKSEGYDLWADSRRISPLGNCWRYRPWLVRLSRRGCQ